MSTAVHLLVLLVSNLFFFGFFGRHQYALNWSARCPRCDTRSSQEDFKCDNCGKGVMKVSKAPGSKRLGCSRCGYANLSSGGLHFMVSCPNCRADLTDESMHVRRFVRWVVRATVGTATTVVLLVVVFFAVFGLLL